MSNYEQNEKKGNRNGIFATITIHALVLLLMWFVLAWQPPDPPLPSFGVELNFGTTDEGSGDVQTTEAAGETQTAEATEEMQEAESEPTEPETEEIVEPTEVVETETESPIEPAPEPKPTPAPTPKKEVVKPTENPKKEEVKPAGGNNNNGDKKGKVGDQGNPDGKLDAKALYGNPGGGGGGAALDLTGWTWDRKPTIKDESSDEGKVVFQIEIDEDGELIKVTTIESTISPAVEKIYRAEVERLSFVRTRDNLAPAPRSVGRVTFIIRNR